MCNIRPCKHVLIYAIILPDTVCMKTAIELAKVINNTHLKHCSHNIDKTAAAYSFWPDISYGYIHRLKRKRVYGKIFNRPIGGAHSEFYAAPFKSRACRTCRTCKPLPVADHNFGICADIHIQGKLLRTIHS